MTFGKILGLGALVAIAASASTSVSATTIGGYNVVASADSLISSTGDFTTSGGSLASVLTDSDDSTYAFSFDENAAVTLGFSSGIENGTGADFVLYELGVPDTFDVTINGVTLAALSTPTGEQAGTFSLNAASFDLTDFGLAPGAAITSVDIGLGTENPSSQTVPSLSYAGVLNEGAPSMSAAPEPSTWLLMIAGIGGVGLSLRRDKRKTAVRFGDALAS